MERKLLKKISSFAILYEYILRKKRYYMVKTVDILGIEINNSSARDLIEIAKEYFNNPSMNMIVSISASMLLQCQSNPMMQEALNMLDLPIIGDVEILAAAGLDSATKRQEIKNNEFFHEFMKHIGKDGRTVYLLGDTTPEIHKLSRYLKDTYDKVKVAGAFAMEQCTGDMDHVINEVNGAAPDVIISILSSPMQEEFLMKEHQKLNASIWYGAGKNYIRTSRLDELKKYANHLIHRGRLIKSISEYDEEVNESHEESKE